jgi:tetratricopeptide (TPR) repeat protein
MKLLAIPILLLCISFGFGETSVSSLMKQGDAFDAAMKTEEALKVYLEAEKLAPKNAELQHRIAKQYGESMNDVTTDKEKKERGTRALDAAQRAVAADEKNPLAQVSLAISYGLMAPLLDNKEKVAYSKLVKTHADKALALDPNCELAYHVLGAWNYELASFGMVMRTLTKMIYGALPEASYAAAETNFLKAIALNPNRVANFVELGRTYKKLDKPKEARTNLDRGIALPSIYRDDEATKARGRQALKDL